MARPAHPANHGRADRRSSASPDHMSTLSRLAAAATRHCRAAAADRERQGRAPRTRGGECSQTGWGGGHSTRRVLGISSFLVPSLVVVPSHTLPPVPVPRQLSSLVLPSHSFAFIQFSIIHPSFLFHIHIFSFILNWNLQ